MVKRALYRLAVPRDVQLQQRREGRRDVRTSGSLSPGSGGGATDAIAVQPTGQRLEVGLRSQGSSKIIEEYAELFDADGFDAVAYHGTRGYGDDYGDSGRTPQDGYYALEGTESDPVIRGDGDGGSVTGRLRKKGTRKSHWRSVKTNPATITNPFGSDTTGYIAAPDDARNVRWSNVDGDTEDATAVTTNNAKHGDVTLYDAQASSFQTSSDNPELIYDLVHIHAGAVDCKVWDPRGVDETDANGVLQWQKVFRPDHQFDGSEVVISTSLLRVYIDDVAQTITAERWNDATTAWESVTLGSSDWVPFDLDIVSIGASRVEFQLEFFNTNVGGGEETYYTYTGVAHRGRDDIQWQDPPNQTTVSTPDLDSLLNPIADPSTVDPQQRRSLRHRQETRL